MIESIVVGLILLAAVGYCVIAARRTLQGKSTCGCDVKSCPAAKSCDSKESGCG